MTIETAIIVRDLQAAGFGITAWGRKCLIHMGRRVNISQVRSALKQLGYDECQYQLKRNELGLGIEVEGVLA